MANSILIFLFKMKETMYGCVVPCAKDGRACA